LNTLTTVPDLGFGSNQVDFGGIINAESATFITSSIYTSQTANAHLQSISHLPNYLNFIEKEEKKNLFSNSLSPLIPPTKSILSSCLISLMPLENENLWLKYVYKNIPNIGSMTKFVSNSISKPLTGCSLRNCFLSVNSNHSFSMKNENTPFFFGFGFSAASIFLISNTFSNYFIQAKIINSSNKEETWANNSLTDFPFKSFKTLL